MAEDIRTLMVRDQTDLTKMLNLTLHMYIACTGRPLHALEYAG